MRTLLGEAKRCFEVGELIQYHRDSGRVLYSSNFDGTLGTTQFLRASTMNGLTYDQLLGYIDNIPNFTNIRYVKNRLTYTESLTNPVWYTAGSLFGSQVGEDGYSTAFKLVFGADVGVDDYITQNIAVLAYSQKTYTQSVWLKGATGLETIKLGASGTQTTIQLSNTWTRYSTTSSNNDISFRVEGIANQTIYISKPQLEYTLVPSEYVKSVSVASTRAYITTNPNIVSNNIVSVSTGQSIDMKGLYIEPASTNLLTCVSKPRVDYTGAPLTISGSGTGWTNLGSNRFSCTANNNAFFLCTGTIGKTYLITFIIEVRTAGYIRVRGGTNYGASETAANTYTHPVLVSGTSAIYLMPAGFTGTIQVLEVIETGDQPRTDLTRYDNNAGAYYNNIPGMTLTATNNDSILSIVEDAPNIANLADITNNFKVYRLQVGTGTATITFSGGWSGTTGTIIGCTLWMRTATGSISIGGSNASEKWPNISYSTYTKWNDAVTTTAASTTLQLTTTSGACDLYFILPQLENYRVATSTIEVNGATATRATTNVYDTTAPPNEGLVQNFLPYSEDFSNALWAKLGTTTITGTTTINTPAVNDGVYQGMSGGTRTLGSTILLSAKLSGSGTISLNGYSGGATQTKQITLTSTPTIYTFKFVVNFTGLVSCYIRRMAGDTATSLVCDFFQAEDISFDTQKEYTGYVPTKASSVNALPALVNSNNGWTVSLDWTYDGGAYSSTSTITTHTLWSNYTGADNYIALKYNGYVLYIEKRVNGVSTYVSFPLTAIQDTTYNIKVIMNPNYTMNLKVNGVSAQSGLGAEILPNGVRLNTDSWAATNSTKVSDTQFDSTTTGAAYVSKTFQTIGRIYQTTFNGTTSSGTLDFYDNSSTAATVGAKNTTFSHIKVGPGPGGLKLTGHSHPAQATALTMSSKEIFNTTDTTAPVYWTTTHIGQFNATQYMNGWIKNFKIINKAQ